MSDPFLSKRFFFRISATCRYRRSLWTASGVELDESHQLISFAELDDRPTWADVRTGWSEEGLAISVHVSGKKQSPWCRANRPEDSDGIQVWIDTRDVHNVHRASRFCHRFLFLPTGEGNRLDRLVAQWLPIHRAHEHPGSIPTDAVRARSELTSDGYRIEAFFSAEGLTGFDPVEHPKLGFYYAVIDRELGEQTLGPGSPMPYQEDPSLWATLDLVR